MFKLQQRNRASPSYARHVSQIPPLSQTSMLQDALIAQLFVTVEVRIKLKLNALTCWTMDSGSTSSLPTDDNLARSIGSKSGSNTAPAIRPTLFKLELHPRKALAVFAVYTTHTFELSAASRITVETYLAHTTQSKIGTLQASDTLFSICFRYNFQVRGFRRPLS